MSIEVEEVVIRFRSLTGLQKLRCYKELQAMVDPPREEMLNSQELANKLRISKRTLDYHLKKGPPDNSICGDVRLIPMLRMGHKRYWKVEDVEEFIKNNFRI